MGWIVGWTFWAMLSKSMKKLAGTTRLELATSAVTGQRSNQLNYVPSFLHSGQDDPGLAETLMAVATLAPTAQKPEGPAYVAEEAKIPPPGALSLLRKRL